MSKNHLENTSTLTNIDHWIIECRIGRGDVTDEPVEEPEEEVVEEHDPVAALELRVT